MSQNARNRLLEFATAIVLMVMLWGLVSHPKPRRILQPEPEKIEVKLSGEERLLLSDEQLRLVTLAESGKLSGAVGSDFRRELLTADDIGGRWGYTQFHFRIHSRLNRGPGVPVWFDVLVHDKTDRIVRCELTSPEW